MVAMFSLSLQEGSLERGYRFTFQVNNYSEAISQYATQILRSFSYGAIATVISLALGFPAAYAIAFRGGRYRSALLFMVILPYFVSALLRTLSWKTILSDSGLLLGTLKDVGLLDESVRVLNTSVAVVGGLVYNYLPFTILPLYVVLERLDVRVFEAAEDLYASRAANFFHVVLPLSLPGILAGALLTFIPVVGDPINSAILGSTSTTMIGNVISREFLTLTDYPTAAALSFTLMALLLATVLVFTRWVRSEDLVVGAPVRVGKKRGPLGGGVWTGLFLSGLYLYLFAPVIVMVAYGFNDIRGEFNFAWRGFTTRWYRELFDIPQLTEAFWNSVGIAVVTTVVSTVLATPIALALARYRFRFRQTSFLALLVPIATPTVIMGAALLSFFVTIDVSRGLITILFAHVTLTLGFVAVTIHSRLSGLDTQLEECAQDLGATEWSAFWTVTLPLIVPAIIAGASIAFALSIDDYVTTSFVAGRTLTLPLWIFGSSRLGVPPQANVMGTLLFVGGVSIALVSSLLRGRRQPLG
ncbi:MAG: ABC transporter permease subunit [Actinomycetota bacterium]